jgi:hypothetical protein
MTSYSRPDRYWQRKETRPILIGLVVLSVISLTLILAQRKMATNPVETTPQEQHPEPLSCARESNGVIITPEPIPIKKTPPAQSSGVLSGRVKLTDLAKSIPLSEYSCFVEALRVKENGPPDNPLNITEAYWRDAMEYLMLYDPVFGYTSGYEYASGNLCDPKKYTLAVQGYALRYDPESWFYKDWVKLGYLHLLGGPRHLYGFDVVNLVEVYEKERNGEK